MRDYTLVLSNRTINADGIEFPYGKVFSYDFPEGQVFNGTFPGPWIQACWGDVSISNISRMAECNKIANTQSHSLQQASIHTVHTEQLQWNQHSLAWIMTVGLHAV